MPKDIVIGSRDSDLAMWQARWVAEKLSLEFPDRRVRITGMKTKGDHILGVALAKIGDKGLFTKELEVALLEGTVDLAVHSMKDLPTSLPAGLIIGAVCPREKPADVLISRDGKTLEQLPPGARVGTSSLRRRAQLLRYRPDLQLVDIRGNLATRLRKLRELDLDAIVLAYAGVKRMGYEEMIAQIIPCEVCLPAVGQGSLGVEIRAGDEEMLALVSTLDHPPSRAAIEAERAFMKRLEGGCQVPIGALGTVEHETMRLEGVVADLHGKNAVRSVVSGPDREAAGLGDKLAQILLDMGAGEILRRARQEFGIHEV